MMLIRLDTMIPWRGERLTDGIAYQINIEELWSDADLKKVGLAKFEPFVLPPGERRVAGPNYVLSAEGVVHEVYTTEQIPPPPTRTRTEKVTNMLSDYGLTLSELKAELAR